MTIIIIYVPAVTKQRRAYCIKGNIIHNNNSGNSILSPLFMFQQLKKKHSTIWLATPVRVNNNQFWIFSKISGKSGKTQGILSL